jgi:adenylate cyclase
MSDIFISYARSNEAQSQMVAAAVRALGYEVWRDDELPAHRAYTEVIEERLRAAKAVVVIWSAEAVKSQWVRAEADVAREAGTLVQLSVDGATLPLPFNQIQCADMAGWTGDLDAPGWRKVVGSIADLVGGSGAVPPAAAVSTANAALALPSKPSIAVLPFANLSGDPEQDYFAAGMTEEITNALSGFPSLFVIASSSTLGYRHGARDLKAIAAQLGVRYLLEGSVRQMAGRVRISVKLADPIDGAQIWTRNFDDTPEDVFALQDRVAGGVGGAIDSALASAEIRRAGRQPTADLGAYDLYLRSMELLTHWDRASILKGLEGLERAIGRDPDYAAAHCMAGYGYHQLWISRWADDQDQCRATALRYCRQALRLGGDDPAVLGYCAATIMGVGEDIDEAERLSERALQMSPGSALTRGPGALAPGSLRRWTAGRRRRRKAKNLCARS